MSARPFCSRLSRRPQGWLSWGLQDAEGQSGLPPSRLLPASCPRLHCRALQGPGPPSAAPSDRSRKSSSSLASTLGLKKLFMALGHGTRPKLGKARSHSVEQLQSPAPGPGSHTSTPRVKKAPSLQSLHLVSLKAPAKG